MLDEDNPPILVAPLVAIAATIAMLLFAQAMPHAKDGGLVATGASTISAFFGR